MALLRNIVNKINIGCKLATLSTPARAFNLLPWLTYQRFFASESAPTPYEVVDPKAGDKETKAIMTKVNSQLQNKQQGRLFAVVHLAGKQFKVTNGDVIAIEGYWPPTVGDKITLDKVMVVGSKDFSLIGRPLVQHGLVGVHATVIEKTLSHIKTHFRKKRRKQYKRINFYRVQQTMLRINNIIINGEVNKPANVTGLEYKIL